MADCTVKIWRPKWYRRTGWRLAALGIVVGFAVGSAATHPRWVQNLVAHKPNAAERVTVVRYGTPPSSPMAHPATSFGKCRSASATDCVIDGDTFRYQGETIRIADIDAPETRKAKCASEAELGARATIRLAALLSQGEFDLSGYDSRNRDQYGRLLRVVTRDGASIGRALVAEGLARRWEGRRRPWC